MPTVDRASTASPVSIASDSTRSTVRESMPRKIDRVCNVAIIDTYSRDEVLVNFDLFGPDIKSGALFGITVLKSEFGKSSNGYGSINKMDHDSHQESNKDSRALGHRYIFIAKDMSKDMKQRYHDAEVCVVKHIADAFGIKRGAHVLLAPVSP